MDEHSLAATRLFGSFPAATPADWEEAVRASLKGRDPESLAGESEDGLPILPIFFRRRPESPPHAKLTDPPDCAPAPGWEIRQQPLAATAAEARREALELAERGQAVVPLDLRLVESMDVAGLLAELTARGARLEVEAGAAPARAAALVAGQPGGHGVVADWLSAGLREGRHPGSAPARELAAVWAAGDPAAEWLASGLAAHEAGATSAQELAVWLAAWVAGLRELEAAGLPLEHALARGRHELSASRDLFETMARLRAARLLAARVLEACELPPEHRAIRLGARGARRTHTRRDPWTNLLRATLQGFAAGAGGAQWLHLPALCEGLGPADELSRRLPGNMQVILQEEALLAKVADPGRGSWYLESLTARLAEKAWSLFQDLEAAGGLWAALSEGLPQAWVREASERRAARLSRRREQLVGTSIYPDLGERLPPWATAPDGDPPAPPGPELDFAPLHPRRLASELEDLRARGERRAAALGRPPVLLARVGEARALAARAAFCRALAAVGGLPVDEPDPAGAEAAAAGAVAAGAPVVVLCAGDEDYPRVAPAFIAHLRRQEAERGVAPALLLLAGRPADQAEALAAAGVQGFLHLKGSVSESLARMVEHLEERA